MELHGNLPNRRDIDGLRAISVLCVFLYHLEIPSFSGGFVGVDLFFVISGYLISRNVLTDAERGRFSFARFYERRIRRLFPAALTTVVGTFAIGALWFSPNHFKALSQDMVATLGSVSNFYFWQGSHAYFAKTIDPSAVLHFWSLAVEEQFYLVWPVLLLVGHRLTGKSLPVVILLIGIVSLAAAQINLAGDATGTFYLPFFRAWEFAIGALVIFAERRIVLPAAGRVGLAVLGYGLIAYAVTRFDAATPFPGAAALIPCVGAACLIWAGPSQPLASVLTNRAAVRIGLVSYSLYLVHWPLIIYANYILGDGAHAVGAKLTVFVLAAVLAELMYRHIETPFRARNTALVPVAIRAGTLVVAVAAMAFVANRQEGWSWRLPPQAREIVDLQRFGFWPCSRSSHSACAFGALNEKTGLQLLGDSFAEQYVATFDAAAKDVALRGEAYTEEGCPLLVGLVRTGFDGTAKCRSQREKYLTAIKRNNAPLVLSQSWLTYGDTVRSELAPRDAGSSPIEIWHNAIEDTIRELGSDGRPFLIVGPGVDPMCRSQMTRFAPGPLWHAPSKPCPPVPLETVKARNTEFNAMLMQVQQRHPDQVRLLFPEQYLCGVECPVVVDGLWLYYDVNHLTVAGARRIGAAADGSIRKFIEAGNAVSRNARP